jgi:hypothetical protein
MGVPLWGSSNPVRRDLGLWVVELPSARVAAQLIAITGQQGWPEDCEVQVPMPVSELAISFFYGLVEADDDGFLRAWFCPRDGRNHSKGFERFEMVPPNKSTWRASSIPSADASRATRLTESPRSDLRVRPAAA